MQDPIFGYATESVHPNADFFRIGIGINPRQTTAFAERPTADFGDGFADGDARQTGAISVFASLFQSDIYILNGRKAVT